MSTRVTLALTILVAVFTWVIAFQAYFDRKRMEQVYYERCLTYTASHPDPVEREAFCSKTWK